MTVRRDDLSRHRPRRRAATRALLLAAAILVPAGCGGGEGGADAAGSGEGEPPGSAGPIPDAPRDSASRAAALAVADSLPATLAYRCPDGTRFEVRFFRDSAWAFLPDRTATLRPEVSASGTRYAGQGVVLRTRDGEARLEVGERDRSGCRGRSTPSAWAEARARGATFRALGQEPGWWLEVHPGDSIVFVHDYGERRAVAPAPEATVETVEEDGSRRVWRAEADGRPLVVEAVDEGCRDVMSGFRFPVSVTVRWRGERYRGCGRPLR